MVKNLRLLREEKGLSQQKLADMLSISQQAIFKYEKTANEPDIMTLIRLAEIFDVTVDYLIGFSQSREHSAKCSTAILTDKEAEHLKRWRSVPEDIRNNIDALLSDIHSLL